MKQNTISLLEIIQLMKEVKDNTDNFITNLKSSLYLEKDGKLINPKFVHIRFFDIDEKYYTITIDGCPFKLDSNGVAIFYEMSFNKNKKEEGQSILNRNRDIITNALIHLHSNLPKYYVAFTNVKGYMSLEDAVGEIQVYADCNRLSINSNNFGQISTINYIINDDNITIGPRNNEIPLNSIAEVLGDRIDVEKLNMLIDESLANIQVEIGKLPLVLKTQMESKYNTKKL